MSTPDLHARLAALDASLRAAEDRLRARGQAATGHRLTNADLRTRYNTLMAQVAREDAAAASAGHPVGDLEHAVRLWVESLDQGGV